MYVLRTNNSVALNNFKKYTPYNFKLDIEGKFLQTFGRTCLI